MKINLSFPIFAALLLLINLSIFGNPQKPGRGQSINPISVTTIAPKSQPLTGSPAHPFTPLWNQADSLANLGQPKSALEIVDKIYTLAKARKDEPQVVKAIIYRIRLNAEFRENFITGTITSLQKEIASSRQPVKQVLQSILAEVYWKYYQNNQYRFRNRTQVKANIPDSLETWDLATISEAITRTYLLSLEQADSLRRIPIGKFSEILETEIFTDGKKDSLTAEGARFVPTMYDFLANRALDYFTSNEVGSTAPATRFEVNQSWFFAPSFNFANNRMMIPADSAAPASFAIRIFRDLAAFHLADKDRRALVETELKRLAFVHEKYTRRGKDSLYPDALRRFEQAEIASPWSSSISYVLAGFLNSQGQLFQPLISDLHKWDVKSAVEVCDKAIQRFPNAEGSKNCRILAKSIKEQSLQVTTESAVPTEKPFLALVGVKNTKQLYFRLIKTDPDTYSENSGTLDRAAFFKFLASLPVTKSWSQEFPDDGDFQKHHAEIAVPGVSAGFWVLLCTRSKDFSVGEPVFSYTPFWSTQISYVSKRNTDASYSYFILDRETGLPLKNVTAEAWEKKYDYRERKNAATKLGDYTADDQGYILIPPSENNAISSSQFLKIHYKDDLLVTDNFYKYPAYNGEERSFLQTMFYTDRAIYRPGQTVYFKGIILEQTGDKSKIKTGHTTKVVFTDVNGQKISEQSFTTNEFGSFNGSFVAPGGVLLGQMTISNESGSASFSVEEYKRPTFEVTSEPLEGNYKLGETLTVSGKALAFAGNAIDGAQVKYRVVRAARFPFWDWGWRWPMPVSQQVEIASGTTTTDGEGKFSITFMATPDNSIEPKTWPVFDFTVTTDVTDLNGETQSVVQDISVGYKALLIETNIPAMVNLTSDTLFKIKTTNLNGRATPSMVTITLQRLHQPDRVYKTRLWDRPDLHLVSQEDFQSRFPYDLYDDENNPETWVKEELVFEKIINTLTDSTLNMKDPATKIPRSGSYLLVLKTTDPFGEVVEEKNFITAFSPESREVPVNTLNWFVPLKTTGEPGEKARFLIGSKEDNVNMIYEVRVNDSLVNREWFKLNDRAMAVEIPITEQYRGNFSVNFMFVKHNRVFQNSQLVSVPHASKKLGITFESFRNKLDPGAKEQWKIKITGPKGKAADAEFLAGMYDASLDQFRVNDWYFNLFQRYSGANPWDIDNAFRTSSGQFFGVPDQDEAYFFHPSLKMNWFGLNYFGSGSGRYSRYSAGGRDKSMRPAMMDGMNAVPAMAEVVTSMPENGQLKLADSSGQKGKVSHPAKTPQAPSMQIRRDFRETVFFYPALRTDSTGSLVLQFTAPESLTRWNFLGLAHSKNLDHGLIEKELVTSKELMVFPNAPRFVRQGDTVIFSTKIVNLSDRDLSGKVTLALMDAITLQSFNRLIDSSQVAGSGKREQLFSMKKGLSTSVAWKLFIPVNSDLSVLQYRVTAVAGNISDGEEKAIPVLTNRMLVTESLPLPVRGKGTASFTFDKLLKSGGQDHSTMKNHKLTLEFASNPAWYAIQALPALNEKQYENADAIFAAFWSNSLAAFIANSNPKIKAVFESWKNLTPDALLSNLAKNQELKSALLQETPWVMEANDESGRKQKLGLFFDHDNLRVNLQENLLKLQKLQSPNGGWTWFAGMPENRYITQNIVTGLGKLDHLGITGILKEQSTREMVMKAIGFLDRELQKDYENLKKYQSGKMVENHIGSTQIQYLYARSFFMANPVSRIPDPGPNFTEAFNYYKGQAAKYWLQSDRSLQGMIALALTRTGNREVPALILKSLSEKAIHSNEMGMYWAGERGYLWHEAPIETQALMVEAFDEVSQDKSSVEELKIWLLKQKQTQDWRSSRATLEACYALLLRGTDLLSDDPGVKITLGREKISSDKLIDIKKEAGTGYFQLSFSGDEIKPEMGKITVSKTGDGVAWGALYWQYFEDLDKISPAATPLHLEKKVFIETNSPTGPKLEPIESSPVHPFTSSPKPGDKLKVRILLTVDRDLEYVHMKDMRASGLEPLNITQKQGGDQGDGLSGYRYQDGLGYYQSTTDVAANFFFDYLPKGTYVFEYGLIVNAAGDYSNGIATIQCMYAPEFTAHSEGIRIHVK
ncbi:MAG: alpha-2-macroglobulin family protein [Bacteroidales bacterium]